MLLQITTLHMGTAFLCVGQSCARYTGGGRAVCSVCDVMCCAVNGISRATERGDLLC